MKILKDIVKFPKIKKGEEMSELKNVKKKSKSVKKIMTEPS